MATVTHRVTGTPQSGNAATPIKADVRTTDADIKAGEDIAPIIEQTDDHIVLDLKNGHPCTLSTIMILFWYHLFVFSPLAPPVIYGVLYLLYRQLGYGVWVTWFLLNLVLFLVPPYYNRAFRQKHLRKMYIPLAHYAKSSKVVLPAKRFPEGRSYILGVHPHGRVMYSTSLISQVYDVFTRVLPVKGDLFGAAAGGFFNVPIIRNWFYALGAVPAGRSSLRKQLNKGNNILIVVGGVKEVCIPTYPDKDVLYLKKRLGFIRLAMETNAGVVPVYLFDENSLFESQPLWFLKFWEKVNRYVNVGVPFFRGIYHLPFPFQRDLMIAFGEPLFAKEGESAESFHARYIEALQNLFDKYVGMTTKPKHKLVIT